MNIRLANNSDYKEFAHIHLKAFNDFFLTSLGIRFLKIYYRASLKSKDSIAICAVDKGNVIGFSSGCRKSKRFHRKLILNNFYIFLLQVIIILLTKPKAIIRLIKNLDKNINPKDDGNYSELLSIAVLPSYKGLGIGKSLIKAFEDEARKRGCKKVALTTDYAENQDVLSFYQNSGYLVYYKFTTFPDRKMYKLIKNIDNDKNLIS